MKLHQITLKNFQGIRDFTANFNGQNTAIFGTNSAGKSTVFNAYTWLLFDKSSTNEKSFSPKTNSPDGGHLHNLEHSVEAAFDTGNRHITLKKTLKETYTKKRGSTVEEFTGHTITYHIDGVPSKEKEFTAFLENSFGSIERIRLLTMIDFFSREMDWKSRRKVLLDMGGDVSDGDVIAGHNSLAKLPGILNGKTVDDYRKIVSAQMKDISRELQAIPGRIDEAKRARPDVDASQQPEIDGRMAECQSAIDDLRQRKISLVTDNGTAGIDRKISELQAQLREAQGNFLADNSERENEIHANISKIRGEMSEIEQRLRVMTMPDPSSVERLTQLRADLITERNIIRAQGWDGSETCPTCNQQLPADEIEAAKARFNLEKSKKLEAITLRGKAECSKEIIEQVQRDIEESKTRYAELKAELSTRQAELEVAQKSLSELPKFSDSPEHQEIQAKIAELESQRNSGTTVNQDAIANIDSEISDLTAEITALQETKSKILLAEQQNKRISELSAQERQIASEYEKLQHGLHLCDEFVKAKVSILTNKINSRFDTVRFKLFEQQINGGIAETCEVLIPRAGALVPYASANKAAQINAGIEIIDCIGKYYGQSLPVWVDNAESVVQLRETGLQIIRLVVSAEDSELRVELEGYSESVVNTNIAEITELDDEF